MSKSGKRSKKDRKKKENQFIGIETVKKNGNVHFDLFVSNKSLPNTEEALKYYEEQAEMIE